MSKDAAVRQLEGDLVSRESRVSLSRNGEDGRLRGEIGMRACALQFSPPTLRHENDFPFAERGAEPGADRLCSRCFPFTAVTHIFMLN